MQEGRQCVSARGEEPVVVRTWQTPSAVKAAVASQSSWSKGSSMVTMGYSLQKPVYMSFSFSLRTSTSA